MSSNWRSAGLTVFKAMAIAAALGFCAASAFADVLNRDSGFEHPAVTDGFPMDSATFEFWSVATSPGTPAVLVRRGASAASGGQAIEFQADGSDSHTRLVSQDLSDLFAMSNRLLVTLKLRAVGNPPTSGGVVLRVSTTVGSELASKTIPYADLSPSWRRYALWPVEPAVPDVGSAMRVDVTVDFMGTDPEFSVWLDDVRMDDRGGLPATIPANMSFESNDLAATGQSSARAISDLSDWAVSTPNPIELTLETSGGSDGAQFLRAASVASGSNWNALQQQSLPGSLIDGLDRFELSVEARHNGVPPNGSEVGPIWLQLFGNGFHGSSQNLIPRRKIEFWNLTDTFQTFRLEGDHPVGSVLENGMPVWQLGDPVDLVLGPASPVTPGSAVEVDNLRFDRIQGPEAFETKPTIVLDTTRPVPTRFETDLAGSARISNGSIYRFFLAEGLQILAAGNDPEVASATGSRIGNLAGIYSVTNTGGIEWIEGERYQIHELTPTNLHPVDTGVGPIFFSSSLPVDTHVSLFYETQWTGGPSPPVRREVNVWTTRFPTLGKPRRWLTSLFWIKASDQIAWPGYLSNLASFGFNAVGGIQIWDGYALPPGAAVPPTALSFYQTARAAGFDLSLNASPFNYSAVTPSNEPARTLDETTGLPVDGAPCPAYGLMDESVYGVDPSRYTDERDRLASWIAELHPESLMLDSEAFTTGAEIALQLDSSHPAGCRRCNDYLDALRLKLADPTVSMAEALLQMGVDRTTDLNKAVVAAGGAPVIAQGYYHTNAASTYQHVWNLEALTASGAANLGFYPFYSNPKVTHSQFPAEQTAALAAGVTFYPITKPAALLSWDRSVRSYDQVNELLGSGARGLVWWPYDLVLGGALYYYGRALEAILPMENLLVQSVQVPGVSGAVGDPNETNPARFAVVASAVQAGPHLFVLVSSYGAAGTQYEDPAWDGLVDVTFPAGMNVRGDIVRLEDGSVVGIATGNDTASFDFRPGVPGARTAVFHICDTTVFGRCTDGDGDGVLDSVDNCLTSANVSQQDSDSDGIGDACDPTPVPEPCTTLLLGSGVLLLAAFARQRATSRATRG